MDNKEMLKDNLSRNVMKIEFTKADGTIREMLCTLDPKRLPESPIKESKKKENPDVLAVFDLEKNAWRSFRLDSVISMRNQ